MNDKQLVGIHAAKLAENGMVIGLGTGSTANYFIEALAERQRNEGLLLTTLPSSTISAIKAQTSGLLVASPAHIEQVDLYVDGADEITPEMAVLKGRGQDLVMEKLLAQAAKHFVVVADKSKLTHRIGEKFPIPIEVLPIAWQLTKRMLEKHDANGNLRLNASNDNVFISAQGNYVLDMHFPTDINAAKLNALLNDTPGVVAHGVFYGLTNTILIAENGAIETRHR